MHPADGPAHHELYLMCDDIRETVKTLQRRGIEFTREISHTRWGLTTALRMPDGSELALYEPKHPSPLSRTD